MCLFSAHLLIIFIYLVSYLGCVPRCPALQTTNKIFNDELFERLEPRTVLSWQRVRAANWLAADGQVGAALRAACWLLAAPGWMAACLPASCMLPAACRLLPAANFLLRSACCLLALNILIPMLCPPACPAGVVAPPGHLQLWHIRELQAQPGFLCNVPVPVPVCPVPMCLHPMAGEGWQSCFLQRGCVPCWQHRCQSCQHTPWCDSMLCTALHCLVLSCTACRTTSTWST